MYEARDPIVHGLGFAAMRDLVSFARYRPADDRGTPNPLFVDAMPALDHAVAVGSSQSGRMARDFVYQGFNEDPQGRRVFDGMTPYVGGARRTFVNARFAQTGRYTRQHEDHNYPMDEFPFTFATTTDPLTGRTDGLLAACTASGTCPNIIQVDAESEYYGAHASLIVTDTSGRALALPPNVRYWMLATAHSQGAAGCRDPANPVQPWPYYRAAFDAMVEWVRNGVEPPATRAPSVADGTAVTVDRQGEQYPTIPDRPYNGAISTLGVRDFSVWPPKESDERYPLFVPSLDADGNLVAGVIVPEVAAPLATMGKAVRAAGFAEGDLCGVNGSTIPFPADEGRADGAGRFAALPGRALSRRRGGVRAALRRSGGRAGRRALSAARRRRDAQEVGRRRLERGRRGALTRDDSPRRSALSLGPVVRSTASRRSSPATCAPRSSSSRSRPSSRAARSRGRRSPSSATATGRST